MHGNRLQTRRSKQKKKEEFPEDNLLVIYGVIEDRLAGEDEVKAEGLKGFIFLQRFKGLHSKRTSNMI